MKTMSALDYFERESRLNWAKICKFYRMVMYSLFGCFDKGIYSSPIQKEN